MEAADGAGGDAPFDAGPDVWDEDEDDCGADACEFAAGWEVLEFCAQKFCVRIRPHARNAIDSPRLMSLILHSAMHRAERIQTTLGRIHLREPASFLFDKVILHAADALCGLKNSLPVGDALAK